MCETLGYDRNQFEGMTVYDITAPDHKEVSLTFLRRATSAEIDHSESEHCYIHKKGHLIWGRVGASLVRDDAGAPLYLVVHAQDITKRKQAEAALQEAHEQLKGIIEFLPDAICVVDRAGKVIAWNRASEEMSGVRKEKMIGMGDYAHAVPFYGEARPVLIDLAMNSNDKHIDLYDCIERQNKLLSGEVFVPNAYGGKGAFLWAKASPLFDKSGDLIGAIEVIRDITDLKEIESRLLKREVDLEEKAHQLEEINTALKVLLRRREEDKKELEESLLTNVEESILPFLEKLKKTRLDENQKTYLAIVESQLGEIVSPFLKSLSSRFTNLTPMEIKVAKFIKEGKSSKEIAEILGVAEKTILTHRSNLRAKLGLRNEKTNLCSHLMSLT
jgi:PAS domain S-box-containing protein